MSIYIPMLYFDGEDETRRPIRYQRNHYPLDDTKRDGAFDLAYIPAHIGTPEMETDRWPAPLKPYLRVGMATEVTEGGIELDGKDVMLDREQVREVRDALSWWLENVEEEEIDRMNKHVEAMLELWIHERMEEEKQEERIAEHPVRKATHRGAFEALNEVLKRMDLIGEARMDSSVIREYERRAAFGEATREMAKYRETETDLEDIVLLMERMRLMERTWRLWVRFGGEEVAG